MSGSYPENNPGILSNENSTEKKEEESGQKIKSPSNTISYPDCPRDLLTLWWKSAQESPEGLSVGCIVFAPFKRNRSSASPIPLSPTPLPSSLSSPSSFSGPNTHYRLAEITGIQSAYGTVTVSFLFTHPGVDDQDVYIFDIIPCSLQWLQEHAPVWCENEEEVSQPFPLVQSSLLERILGVPRHKGPLPEEVLLQRVKQSATRRVSYDPVTEWLSALHAGDSDDEIEDTTIPQQKRRKRRRGSGIANSGSHIGGPSAPYTMMIDYTASRSLHQGYAEAFRYMAYLVGSEWKKFQPTATEQRGQLSARAHIHRTETSPVALCVFNCQALLRRFNFFMSLRGHVVETIQLQSEASNIKNSVAFTIGGSQGRPSLLLSEIREPLAQSAFGMRCISWLCVVESDIVTSGESITSVLNNLLIVKYLFLVEQGVKNPEARIKSVSSAVSTTVKKFWAIAFKNFPDLSVSCKGKATESVVHVSGEIFDDQKLLVPASPEQLLLLKTIAHFNSSQDKPENVQNLPLLLERISLGSFTDLSVSSLFTSYAKVVATVGKTESYLSSVDVIHRNFFRESVLFGLSFPIFAVVLALIQDEYTIFQSNLSDESIFTSVPRVALVVPKGNPTGNPQLASKQFVRNLKEYFSPWMVYESFTFEDGIQQKKCLSWYSRGGIMLLYCDELVSQLGSIQLEADLVIACGKRAATWVAASVGSVDADKVSQRYFAVISEVEVVQECETHVWASYCPPSFSSEDVTLQGDDSSSTAEIEMADVWNRLVNFFVNANPEQCAMPKPLQQSMEIYFYEKEKPNSAKRRRLLQVVRSIALCCAALNGIKLEEISLQNLYS